MTFPLYAIAQRGLSLLPVDAAGRRCFDETLADWRKEAAQASGPLAAVAVPVRAIWSLFRCLMMISVGELRGREGIASLLHLAVWSMACVLLAVAFNWNRTIEVEGEPLGIGFSGVALGSVAWAVVFMPLLAFVSGAFRRRTPVQAPRLGPALVVGAVMLVAMGWGLPAANQAYREILFEMTSGRGVLPPSIAERSVAELFGMLTTKDFSRAASVLNLRLVFIVAAPLMLVLGVTARQLRGWRRVAGSLLPLLVFGVPFLWSIDSLEGFFSLWPALLAVILITRTLVRGADRERAEPGGSVTPGLAT